jgi:multisubunit Na+/H+ antiporter MnhC subunit
VRQLGGRATLRRVEFLTFLFIFASGYLVLRHPDRERLAFGLAVAGLGLMVFLFLVGTRTSLLPGLNY